MATYPPILLFFMEVPYALRHNLLLIKMKRGLQIKQKANVRRNK
jgi:hypothetical protein